jgi:hypothetical protein
MPLTASIEPETDAFAIVAIVPDVNADGPAFGVVKLAYRAHLDDSAAGGFGISHKGSMAESRWLCPKIACHHPLPW